MGFCQRLLLLRAAGFDGSGDGVDAVEDGAGGVGVGELEAEFFLEGDDELEGVNGVEGQALWAEEGGIRGDGFRSHGEHEFGDHEFADLLLEYVHVGGVGAE